MEIAEHLFVPKHAKLSEEESKRVLARHNLTPAQLPQILKGDPAIKNLGAKPGDIIKITRKSPTVVEVEFFRIVSEE